MEQTMLQEIVIIFVLSILIIYVTHRFKMPTIVGFIITGIIVGPHGIGLVSVVEDVKILAEIGVVLMLFTIGIEFSLKNLLHIRRAVLLGGSLQVILTFFASFAIAFRSGIPVNQSIFLGFLISLSSTAIVMKILQDKAEIDSPHGTASLGILIFQDLIIVPMILLIPLLAGSGQNITNSFLMFMLKTVGVIVLVILSAKVFIPYILYQTARTRNREIFLFSIVAMCFAIAWMTSSIGLSLALGAFLAGLIISESEYSHQALGNIIPFRDIFTSFFFLSIGMLLDITALSQNIGLIVLITVSVISLKIITTGSAASLMGLPYRITVLVAFTLGQIGEFSFILAETGLSYGLLSAASFQLFLVVAIITMLLTPLQMTIAPALANLLGRLPMPSRIKNGCYKIDSRKTEGLVAHLIIVGFGLNGRNLAEAASSSGIPFLVIETNPETVRAGRERGDNFIFGDATQEEVLSHAGISKARIIVIVISDPAATRRITELSRRMNPDICIIVRTRFLKELDILRSLGADEVVPEEYETSIEIFTRVLHKYLVPDDEIKEMIDEVRSSGYQMLRTVSKQKPTFSDLKGLFSEIEVSAFRIAENSPAVNKTLADLELRNKHYVSLIAVRQDHLGGQMILNPNRETILLPGAIVAVVGAKEDIDRVKRLFGY